MGNNEDAKDMEYLGQHSGYQCWKNSDGYIEGFKSIGLVNIKTYCRPAKDLIRLVTKAVTIEEFNEAVKIKETKEKQKKTISKAKDKTQLKLDFYE